MDDLRFDEIARSLGAIETRRGAVRLLAVAAGWYRWRTDLGLDSEARRGRRRSGSGARSAPSRRYWRCMAPATEALPGRRPKTANRSVLNRTQSACQSCSRSPPFDAAATAAAVDTCEDEVCRGWARSPTRPSGQRPEISGDCVTRRPVATLAALSCSMPRRRQRRRQRLRDAGAALGCLGRAGLRAPAASRSAGPRPKLRLGALQSAAQRLRHRRLLHPEHLLPRPRDTVCNGACCRYDQVRTVRRRGVRRLQATGADAAGRRRAAVSANARASPSRAAGTLAATRGRRGARGARVRISRRPSVSAAEGLRRRGSSRPASARTAPTECRRDLLRQRDRRAATNPGRRRRTELANRACRRRGTISGQRYARGAASTPAAVNTSSKWATRSS